jgi:hypothetical protein
MDEGQHELVARPDPGTEGRAAAAALDDFKHRKKRPEQQQGTGSHTGCDRPRHPTTAHGQCRANNERPEEATFIVNAISTHPQAPVIRNPLLRIPVVLVDANALSENPSLRGHHFIRPFSL